MIEDGRTGTQQGEIVSVKGISGHFTAGALPNFTDYHQYIF